MPLRFISWLLIIASAIIIGLSSGLVVGMTDVKKASQVEQISKTKPPTEQPQKKPQSVSTSSTSSSAPATVDESDNSTGESAYSPRDLSGADLAQVGEMLENLGYTTSKGIVPAVQKYQEDNALTATGALDMDTLQNMVNQLRVNRVKQLTAHKTS